MNSSPVTRAAAYTTFAAVLSLLSACTFPTERTSTLDQHQRENVSQRATSDFSKSLDPAPINVVVEGRDGSKTTITQPPRTHITGNATTEEKSASDASGSSLDSVTIPLFVKIIGLAIGIGLLALVIGGIVWYLRKSSVALDTLYTQADSALAKRISTVQALKGATTDPARIQALTEAEALMSAARADTNK